MKKFNLGFTVAEVIVALGIVGIVASTVVPMLTKNIQKQIFAATLARTVEQFELGCRNLIEYENARATNGVGLISKLTDITEISIDKLASFVGFQKTDRNIKESAIETYALVPSNILVTTVYADDTPEETPLDVYKLNSIDATVSFLSSIDLTKTSINDEIVGFIIDTNGTANKPNMYGKDVFKFELLNNGKVKPYGNADDCKVGNVKDGKACAARVVADGWKIKY